MLAMKPQLRRQILFVTAISFLGCNQQTAGIPQPIVPHGEAVTTLLAGGQNEWTIASTDTQYAAIRQIVVKKYPDLEGDDLEKRIGMICGLLDSANYDGKTVSQMAEYRCE
jgi:hypothetical protein